MQRTAVVFRASSRGLHNLNDGYARLHTVTRDPKHGVTSVRPGHEAVPDAYSTLVPDAPRSCAVPQEGLKGTYSPEAEAGATA